MKRKEPDSQKKAGRKKESTDKNGISLSQTLMESLTPLVTYNLSRSSSKGQK